jgi:fido (protein-threonine AMPylation protein)
MALQANRQKQWQRIVEAGLCPGITDFETYEAKATEQLELAYRALTGRSIAVPSPVDAAAIHAIIFEGIHPWAGEFRKMGETVRFDRGVVGLDAHRIIPELERIALETKKALDESKSPQDKAMAITWSAEGSRGTARSLPLAN